MSITPDKLGGDEDTARRILALAASIAPCITDFPDESEDQLTAIAILKGAIAELPPAGGARTRSMSRNGTSISYDTAATALSADARDSLSTLCGSTSTREGALPVGSFPVEPVVARLWPEGPYV